MRIGVFVKFPRMAVHTGGPLGPSVSYRISEELTLLAVPIAR